MLVKYLQAFKDIIYPSLCFACERKIPQGYLCQEKYKNYDYLGRFLSCLMIQHIERIGLDLSCYQAIIPVPLHPFKRKERGYNQTELLAEQIANHFQIPLRNDIIYQKKDKTSQTRLKKEQREKAMQGVFSAQKDLKDKNVILIDDILTTGSTLKECALALKEKGAKDIMAITLSKTLN